MPKNGDKPIHGLVSDKNFIVANAVENILAGKWESKLERFRLQFWLRNGLTNHNLNLAPKLPASKDKDYLKKKNYGKVPKYVTKIKGEIEDEYNLVREMQIEEQNERDR